MYMYLKLIRKLIRLRLKQVIEAKFGVKVENVTTVNIRPKKKRVGKYTGTTKAYKKAMIILKEGSKIEF